MLLKAPKKIDESDLFLMKPDHISFIKTGHGDLYKVPLWVTLFLWCFTIVGVAIGLVELYRTMNEQTILSQLVEGGIITQAVVVQRRTSEGKSISYFLTYRYSATTSSNQPESYTYEESVDKGLYNSKQNGDFLPIRYLPKQPEISRILLPPITDWLASYLPSLILFLTTPILMITFISAARRRRRLENEGQVIEGEITDCKGRKVNNKYQISTKYRFNTPLGEEKKGKSTFPRSDLQAAPLPSPGTRVAILYVNEKLYQIL